MHFAQLFSCFLLIVQTVLTRSISPFQAPNPLSNRSISKRWELDLPGFPVEGSNPAGPITREDIGRYIDQIAELSRYIVDNVQADDAIFLQFFGGAEFYAPVIGVFRRLAEIRTYRRPIPQNNVMEINVDLTATPNNEPDANGVNRAPVAQYTNPGGARPTVTLYQEWTTLQDVLIMTPGETSEGQLERFRATRQGVIFHELMHFVGDVDIYGGVIPNIDYDIRYDGAFGRGRIVDAHILGGTGDQENEIQHVEQVTRLTRGQLADARAYGERNVLLLAQLRYGSFGAIHNADTYALFAIALLINWNRNRAIVPSHGGLQDVYGNGNDRDPWNDTRSPFRGMGVNATRVNMWWKTSGRKGL